MLWFYLKYTLKSFRSNKLIAFGSLLSIVLGVLSSFLIYQWVHNELTMDRFHKNAEHIYLMTGKNSPLSEFKPTEPGAYYKLDYNNYPHIKKKLTVTQYHENDVKLIYNKTEYSGEGMMVDSTFFDFFDFELSVGDPEHILDDPENIILTSGLSKKIFGDKNPLGQTLKLECTRTGTYKVAGILADIPSNSSLEFDFLVPRHSQGNWGRMGAELILVDDGFESNVFKDNISYKRGKRDMEVSLSPLPFKSIYFDHHFNNSFRTKFGYIENVKTMIAISIIILLISFLNFVNLQTTGFFSQARLMGIKKVNGASKLNLITQLLCDRIVYVLVSSAAIYITYLLIYPYYSQFLGFEIHHQPLWDLMLIAGATSIISMISALFPLLQLAKIDVYTALLGRLSGVGSSVISKSLTTIQYAITIVLMISAFFVFRQLDFMLNKNLGLSYKNIVSIKLMDEIAWDRTIQRTEEEAREFYRVQMEKQNSVQTYIMDQLSSNPDVLHVSRGMLPIGTEAYPMSWKIVGDNPEYTTENMLVVNPNYNDILDLKLVEGRFFSDSLDKSRQPKVVINEAAKRLWNIGDIEGQHLANQSWGGEKKPYQITGVVKDYHYEHLSHRIKPLMMLVMIDFEDPFLIRFQKGRLNEGITFIKSLQEEISPNKLFSYTLLEDKIRAQYEKEKRLSQVYLFFTLLALFISSIGLFTFALYETRKRTKEIGLRKVNGASIREVVRMLNYTFLRWVALAFVIGCPIGYYLMDRWLQTFANKINLDWWVFALVGLVTVALALLTVSWQSWRVARQNPVEALRYE